MRRCRVEARDASTTLHRPKLWPTQRQRHTSKTPLAALNLTKILSIPICGHDGDTVGAASGVGTPGAVPGDSDSNASDTIQIKVTTWNGAVPFEGWIYIVSGPQIRIGTAGVGLVQAGG